jgi:hypothetical protein
MAKEHVYANKGNGPCPYEKGTAEYSHWHRVQKHYWNMERYFREMEDVYGAVSEAKQ